MAPDKFTLGIVSFVPCSEVFVLDTEQFVGLGTVVEDEDLLADLIAFGFGEDVNPDPVVDTTKDETRSFVSKSCICMPLTFKR